MFWSERSRSRRRAFAEIELEYGLQCEKPTDIHEHLPLLKKYASRCRRVTEMGVREVVSTWALLAANPKVLRCYDLAFHPNMERAENIARMAGIDLRFVIADTTQVEIEPTEFLFIDTLHTYDHLRTELSLHANRVSKYIALHDTNMFGEVGETPNSKGLTPAIEEFLQAWPKWRMELRLSNNNGLTILKKVAA